MSEYKRPLSPHLQVYRLPMLALISITHRASGVFLSIAALLIPFMLVTLAVCGEEAYSQVQSCFQTWYGQGLLFCVSLALSFHLLNGVRHLFWDVGMGLEVDSADTSGVLVIILSLLLTTLIWLLAKGVLGGGA